MTDHTKRRTPSRSQANDERGFVTVKRNGGWKTDIPSVIHSDAYQQQLDAVEKLARKGFFDKESA